LKAFKKFILTSIIYQIDSKLKAMFICKERYYCIGPVPQTTTAASKLAMIADDIVSTRIKIANDAGL
jgi:hypothetical protein